MKKANVIPFVVGVMSQTNQIHFIINKKYTFSSRLHLVSTYKKFKTDTKQLA